jgi:hypothetical protein
MSLQIAVNSLSNVGNPALQAYQSYNYAPVNPKLDPITEQILNTHDAALEVMQQIESGATARFWESQKTIPSVTWLGDVVDRLFGWGRYAQETESALPTQRKALANEQEDVCSKEHTSSLNGAQKNSEHERGVVWDTLYTSFEVQNYPNGSCALINSDEYYFFVD